MTHREELQAIVKALSTGAPAQAERQCRGLLARTPADPDLLLLLAISLHRQQRLDEAVELYARLTRLQPDSGVHWANHAAALREQAERGPHPEAGLRASAEAYDMALRCDPRNVATLVDSGLLLLRTGDFPAARERLLQAWRLDPDTPRTRIHAARACQACGDTLVGTLLEPWRSWTSLDTGLQLELARLLAAEGSADDAVTVLRGLLAHNPGTPQAQLQLAALMERASRLDEAEALLRDLAAAPDDAAIAAEVVHQRAVLALRRGDPAAARRLLEQAGPRDASDFAHYFVLGQACDELEETSAALAAFAQAHERQVAHLRRVAPHRFVAGAPVLPEAAARVDAPSHARWPHLRAPVADESPVFVVGFPRSGTTLLEQMLDAHPQLQSMDERPFLTILADELATLGVRVPQELERLGQDDCDGLRRRYRELVAARVACGAGVRVVDKNPLNMLRLPLFHRLFPRARIIFAVRHPCDVVLSCYMQQFRSTLLAAACADLERLARTYVAAMQHWLHHVALFAPEVLVVRYESLLDDPAAGTRRIADYLELADATPMLAFDRHARSKAFIATPSYTRVTRPLDRRRAGRWLRYRAQLEPLLGILEPMLRHWGYAAVDDGLPIDVRVSRD